MNWNKKLIALAVPATLALTAGGMVAAYATTASPAAAVESIEANEPAEAAEAPEAPGAPEIGRADDTTDASAHHQHEGEE